jgi:excinuclease ABC subunit C
MVNNMKRASKPTDENIKPDNKISSQIARLNEEIKNLPDMPGVYLMKNSGGIVIYIGKANSIKKRVRSYFTGTKDKRPAIKFLLPKISSVDFIVTKSEKEALILENTLIKKYAPKYNINLKDDKSYLSLKITVKNKFPRIFATRRVKKDKSKYFGPYSSAGALRETIDILRSIFLLRTCTDSNLKNRSRSCLNHQIKKCSAPCVGYISEEDYKKSVDGMIMFLNGDVKGLVRALKEQMKKASIKENFEEAARIRDQIKAIELTVEKQRAVTHKRHLNNDIIGTYIAGDDASISIINVRGGSITSLKNHIFLNKRLGAGETLSSFIKQFYHKDKEIPNEIILSGNVEDSALIKEWLAEKRGGSVNIKIPKRGETRRIMEMAVENAKQSLINKIKSKDDTKKALALIKEKLNLQNIPKIMECYDISNIMGRHAVGSKTVLRDGAFDKAGYRRYKIKTRTEADDYGMMYEVLKRRFKKADKLPDLILIDGGKGHLGIALRILKEMKISGIDVISIAKEKRLKTGTKEERVYLPGRKNPVIISGLGAAFNVLIKLRDEAHRFAVSYHKKLRKKEMTASVFDGIKGIGPKKKELILTNIDNPADMTEENLKNIKGLTKRDIASILKSI